MMDSEIQNIEIKDIEQLRQLLKEKKLYHLPKDIRLSLEIPWIKEEQKVDYEEKLSNYISECGCSKGAFWSRLLTLIALFGLGCFIAFTLSISLLIKLILVLAIPGVFVLANSLAPLISLVGFVVILLNYRASIEPNYLIFLGILALAYGVGAISGKTYASLKARRDYSSLVDELETFQPSHNAN